MIKNLILVFFVSIFSYKPLFAKDYKCEPTQFHTKPEYFNVITELENDKVIYIWKLPSSIQFVKANSISEIEDNIIFYEELETYYENGNTFKTGNKYFKKLVINEDSAIISSFSKFDVGNNVEWVTHKCREVK
jgi:hypothetical protein